MDARPGGAGEEWAPGPPLNRQGGTRARPGALQVLKFSADGNAGRRSGGERAGNFSLDVVAWLDPGSGGSSGSRRSDLSGDRHSETSRLRELGSQSGCGDPPRPEWEE